MTSTTLEESMSTTRRLTRLLRWCAGAVAVALAIAGCGGGAGGGGEVTPTAAAPERSDQVAAFALTQQSVAARMGPLAAVPPVTATGTTGTTGNLILNGGFESGMTGWVNWGNAAVVPGQGSSGTSALSVGTDAGGAGYDVGGVVAGSTYRLTAQTRVSAAAEIVYVGVNFVDQWGTAVTQNAVPISSVVYTTVSFEAVAPPNAARAVVYVWKNAGSGPGYVDDVTFTGVAGAAPGSGSSVNLVTNPGFESGLANWVNWGNSTSSAQAAAGSSAAQVGTGAGGFGQHVLGGVVPGNHYRLTSQAKVSATDEIGYLGVMFTDDAGTALLVQNVLFRSTAYGAAQTDVIAPANATRAVVFVWKNAGSGLAMVDEVTLVQVAPGTVTPPPVDNTGGGPEVPVTSPAGSPVFQLPWGGAMSGSVFAFGPNVLRRYSSDGVPVGTAATINAPPMQSNGGSATVLQGGGYAASWILLAPSIVVASRIYTQAFTAAAQPIGNPFAIALSRVADDLGNPAAAPHMAPLAGGGYVVAWALQQSTAGGANDRGVYTQRFDANGQPAGPAQQATADGAGFLHIIGTTTGGYVVSWGKATGAVGGARAYGADGAALAPEQVAGDSWHVGAGPRGSMAPLAGGGAAIVQQVQNQPVFVQHISASGVALPAQVASNLSSPGRAFVAIAGLPDGGSVAAWVEIPVGGFGGRVVYARRFAADGTPMGTQTRVNLTTTPTNLTEIMVLGDGRFTISWDVGTTRYGRTFPANGLVAP